MFTGSREWDMGIFGLLHLVSVKPVGGPEMEIREGGETDRTWSRRFLLVKKRILDIILG